MIVKPRRLEPGSNIGVIAPSSPCDDEGAVSDGAGFLREAGFNVMIGDTVYKRNRYLSGSDSERARDVNEFFLNKDIDGIICVRGGYGATRILNLLDYEAIAQNPKVFIGYSDITAIHVAINRLCNFVTFHGPMLANLSRSMDEYTRNSFIRAITSPEIPGEIKNPEGCGAIKVMCGGSAKGALIGGNLSVISSSVGSRFEIDTAGKILLLEDVAEEPYRVDRMLTQLLLAGKLQSCAGIVLGQWTRCTATHPERSFLLSEVLEDRLSDLGIPVLYNLCCGHGRVKATIPLGVEASITDDGRLFIDEPALV